MKKTLKTLRAGLWLGVWAGLLAGVTASAQNTRTLWVTNNVAADVEVDLTAYTESKTFTLGNKDAGFGVALTYTGSVDVGTTNTVKLTLQRSSDKTNWEKAHVLIGKVTASSAVTLTADIPANGFRHWRLQTLAYVSVFTEASGYITNIAASVTMVETPITLRLPEYTSDVYQFAFTNTIVGAGKTLYVSTPAINATDFDFVDVIVNGGFHATATNGVVFELSRAPRGTAATYDLTGEKILLPPNWMQSPQTLGAVPLTFMTEGVRLPVENANQIRIERAANFNGFAAFTNGVYRFRLLKK